MPKAQNPRHRRPPIQHLGARRPDRYNLDRRLVTVEREVGEWAKDMRHRARQAGRLIYRKQKPVKRGKHYKLRVAGRGLVNVGRGLAGTAAATVAGTYLTTRWTAHHTRRGLVYAGPRINRVAGHTARYAHSYGTVYGGAAYERASVVARKANRRVARARVRNRLKFNKMRARTAQKLDHAHTRAFEKGRERKAKLLLAGAIRVAPRRPASMLSSMKPTPAQVRAQRAEDANVRKAERHLDASQRERRRPQGKAARRRRHLERQPRGAGGQALQRRGIRGPAPIPLPAASHRNGTAPQPGQPAVTAPGPLPARRSRAAITTTTQTRGGIVMAQPSPAGQLENAYNNLANYTPEDAWDWMTQIIGLARAHRVGASGVSALAVQMDIHERMDPRTLTDLYLSAEALAAAAILFGRSADQFWHLYRDRMEQDGTRGRAMRNENQFFNRP